MNIAGLSTVMATSNVQSQVGTAVLSKTMDTNEALGQGLVQMIDSAAMERSVNPNVGSNFDMRV
ncbi:MAG: YjfB family protein [Lachnospiraceae bacterium]|nr:YjfB family protein [Lachnospiraceae bacterium]